MRGQLRAARRAIIFFFCSTGSVYGLLTARLPALREHLQAGEALIGMAMLSLGCGSLVGFAAMHVSSATGARATYSGWGASACCSRCRSAVWLPTACCSARPAACWAAASPLPTWP